MGSIEVGGGASVSATAMFPASSEAFRVVVDVGFGDMTIRHRW
ncbi:MULTISPECIES: hypothetical protein [Pseudonocardia]|nr:MULTISPECIES: hypothetical protein [Pseudonocardia]